MGGEKKQLHKILHANYVDIKKGVAFTLRGQSLSIGGGCHAKLFGSAESSAVEEYWQVDNVSHVVVAIDVRVSKHTVEVLIDCFNYNVGVAGKNGDKRTLREEDSHLERKRNKR